MDNIIKREEWADIAKGIGIIAVVMGHSGNEYVFHYVYWFHMPLFFLLSGYFYKPVNGISQISSTIKKYSVRLLVPYFSFLVLITCLRYIFRFIDGKFDISWLLQDLGTLLIGGRLIGGWYGPFWFVTTLFLTYIIFALMTVLIKKDINRIIILVLFYLIAHVEAWINIKFSFAIPFNLDVSLISISYFAFGYYAKKLLSKISIRLLIISLGVSAIFYFSSLVNILDFTFNMKYLEYYNPILDFLVPMTISISVIGLAQIFSHYKSTRILSYFGKLSLPIMYLHILPNGVLQPILGYGILFYTIIGLAFPVITSFFINKFSLTKYLFFGKKDFESPF